MARPLGTDLFDAAYGVHTIANATMIRAIRAVSTYRGRDPREFTLLAFGGNGPVMAAGIARSLSMNRVVVPPAPGVFSAVGLLEAKLEYGFVQTFFGLLSAVDLISLNAVYSGVEQRAVETLSGDGYAVADISWERAADLRYVGQAFELTVSAPGGTLTASDLASLAETFHAEHQRTYGHRATEEPVEIVNVRLTARGSEHQTKPDNPVLPDPGAVAESRNVFFGPEHGHHTTPIVSRGQLGPSGIAGPVIVEEYDATTVVPPGSTARRDEHDNIVIDLE